MLSLEHIQNYKRSLEQRRNEQGLLPEDWANLQAVRAYEMVYLGKVEEAEQFLSKAEKNLAGDHQHLFFWGLALADFGFFHRAYGHLTKYTENGENRANIAQALLLMLALRLVQHKADNRWRKFMDRCFMARIILPDGLPSRVFDYGGPENILETLGLLERLEQTSLANADQTYLFLRSESLFLAGHSVEVLETCRRLRSAGATYPKLNFERMALLQLGEGHRALQVKKESLEGLLRAVRKDIDAKLASNDKQGSGELVAWTNGLMKNQARQLICRVESLNRHCEDVKIDSRETPPSPAMVLDYLEVDTEGVRQRRNPFHPPFAQVAHIHDAEILDGTSRLLVDEKVLIRESLPEDPFCRNHWKDMEFGDSGQCVAGLPEAEVWEGPPCAIASYGLAKGGNNYFTWLIHIMAGIQLYLDQPEEWRRDLKLFFPYKLQPWQRRMLSCVGVTEDEVVEYEGRFPLRFDTIQYLCACLDEVPARDVVVKLRQRLWERLNLKPCRPHRRLYISREDIVNRRLVNEVEVRALYEKAGYEVIRPERLTFEEQARLFSEALCLAGPSGAWGANILYCQPGATVTMVCRSQSCDNIGAYHAQLFGVQYIIAPVPFVPTAQSLSWGKIINGRGEYYLDSCHINYYVPLETVVNLIQATEESVKGVS